MASVITIAGEQLFAAKAQANEQLDIDTFIFANVPNQDPSAPINREEGIPTAHIVYQQNVQQVGRINDNVVVYSTVLDSITGPFEFNWVGLYSSVNQKLVAINHVPTVTKTATAPGEAGNTLNRNFGIEYSGIAALTNITVDAETWQLNFTARLSGMDLLTQQLAADMNGKDWFIEDGLKVVPRATANSFSVTPGVGYVSGLRVELKQEHILIVQSYPQFVYVDAWFSGNANSTWSPQLAFTVTNAEMDDYIDPSGTQHYVYKLARIFTSDMVEDFRAEAAGASRQWVEDSGNLQTDMINGNGGVLVGTYLSLIGKNIDGKSSLQVNKFPSDDKNTLFNLVPPRSGIIKNINFIEGIVTFEGSVEPSYLSERSAENNLDIRQFKLDATGSVDETNKLKAIALASKGKRVYGFKGKLRVSESISFLEPLSIDFGDVEFIVNKDSDILTGAVINIGYIGQEEVFTTTETLEEGKISLGNIGGVNVGDIISIWNPVDASWSGYRPAYRQGEYHRVISVNPVIIDGPLFDTYPSGSKIFILPANKINVTGKVRISNIGQYGQIIGVRLVTLLNSNFSGLDVDLIGGTHALITERCLNCSGQNMRAFQQSELTSSLDYGLVISASQNCQFNGEFHGERHGATYGSGGRDGDAINRDCLITGNVTTTGKGGVQAANLHGNAERCGFGGLLQGYNPAGHDSYVTKGTKIVSPKINISPVQFTEMKSTKHSISGAEIVMYGTTTGRGIIDAGGNSTSFNEYCVIGGVIDLSNVKIEGKEHNKSVVNIRNRGSNVQWYINSDGVIADVPNSIVGAAIIPVSGTPPLKMSFIDSKLWQVGTGLSIDPNTETSGIYLYGDGNIFVEASEMSASTPITFLKSFHKKPMITINYDNENIGNSVPILKDTVTKSTGFTIVAINAREETWPESGTINYKWKAEV
ncbi:phage tail protein [Shewanella baltica]|uniref:phage tail-collar fiber domain-containing protein n=1 Tax=Shewanella baltica TaxID=62322 RepID=UPI002871C86B|nr:phage tail protein [Shewanella baltica]MDR9767698.1 phage tail protein [Shewanella baltica]